MRGRIYRSTGPGALCARELGEGVTRQAQSLPLDREMCCIYCEGSTCMYCEGSTCMYEYCEKGAGSKQPRMGRGVVRVGNVMCEQIAA